MTNFIKEFKEFALKGNVIDLAIAVVIGATFNKIVTSLVENIIMPLVGFIIGGSDFKNLTLNLNEKTVVKYGIFIQTVVDFFLIAFTIFIFTKLISKVKKKQEAEAKVEKPNNQEVLLTEIRDLLKSK